MNFKSLMGLAIALLMFPQIAQTLYSPALSDIGLVFAVKPPVAAQMLSVFFLAFAVGVVVWGRLCDRLGRRPTMLAGLTLYAAATVLGLTASEFRWWALRLQRARRSVCLQVRAWCSCLAIVAYWRACCC